MPKFKIEFDSKSDRKTAQAEFKQLNKEECGIKSVKSDGCTLKLKTDKTWAKPDINRVINEAGISDYETIATRDKEAIKHYEQGGYDYI